MSPEEIKIIHPWAYASLEEVFAGQRTWMMYMRAWEDWKAETKLPYLEIRYQEMGEQAASIARFLEIEPGPMVEIFNKQFGSRENQWRETLPDIQLPEEWVSMAKKYGVY
jgi:hypothetical protein